MGEHLEDITNDITEFKVRTRQFINKYNIKSLYIDITEDEILKDKKDITLSIEL